jgi:hypothetical protein
LQHRDKALYLGGFAGTLDAFKGNKHGSLSLRRLLSKVNKKGSRIQGLKDWRGPGA